MWWWMVGNEKLWQVMGEGDREWQGVIWIDVTWDEKCSEKFERMRWMIVGGVH